MGVHPLTLLTLAYAGSDQTKIDRLLVQVRQGLSGIIEVDEEGESSSKSE